jgi:flagellar basal body-associated protein FliL
MCLFFLNGNNKQKRKRGERRMRRKEEGITLIALVITIIVLLLLAGVSIVSLTGENGLLTKAKLAVSKHSNAQNDEKGELNQMENLIDRYQANSDSYKKISAELFFFTPSNSKWNVENVKEALDYLYSNKN